MEVVQKKEQQKRLLNAPEAINAYQPGDMVLLDEFRFGGRESKLQPRFAGPYVVLCTRRALS